MRCPAPGAPGGPWCPWRAPAGCGDRWASRCGARCWGWGWGLPHRHRLGALSAVSGILDAFTRSWLSLLMAVPPIVSRHRHARPRSDRRRRAAGRRARLGAPDHRLDARRHRPGRPRPARDGPRLRSRPCLARAPYDPLEPVRVPHRRRCTNESIPTRRPGLERRGGRPGAGRLLVQGGRGGLVVLDLQWPHRRSARLRAHDAGVHGAHGGVRRRTQERGRGRGGHDPELGRRRRAHLAAARPRGGCRGPPTWVPILAPRGTICGWRRSPCGACSTSSVRRRTRGPTTWACSRAGGSACRRRTTCPIWSSAICSRRRASTRPASTSSRTPTRRSC